MPVFKSKPSAKSSNSPEEFEETELMLNRDGSVYHLNLLPEHISDVIITVGDPGRVYRVSNYFDSIDFEMNRREFITHTGIYKGRKVTVLSTGMGTDNVEIVMNELDALVNINLKTRKPKARHTRLKIIRVGTSGALQQDIKLGTHLAAHRAFGLDVLMHFYQFEMGETEAQLSNALREAIGLTYDPYCASASPKLLEAFSGITETGNTVTCPGFYAPQSRQLRYGLHFPKMLEKLVYFNEQDTWITNLEMETAGYYALGQILQHDVISLNAIIANRTNKRVSKAPNKVIDSLIKKTLELVKDL